MEKYHLVHQALEEIIGHKQELELFEYADSFIKKVSKNVYSTENKCALELLTDILLLEIDSNDLRSPYKLPFIIRNEKVFVPEELSKNDRDVLEQVADKMLLNELQARIYDVLWIADKSRNDLAEKASDLFLECAELSYLPQKHNVPLDSIERALQIAVSINGKNSTRVNNIVVRLNSWLNGQKEQKNYYLIYKSISILLDYKLSEANTLLKHAIEFLEVLEGKIYPQLSNDENLWNLVIKVAQKSGNKEEEINVKKKLVRAYELSANIEKNDFKKALYLSKAIKHGSQIPNFKKNNNDLQTALSHAQTSLADSRKVKSIISEIDISQLKKLATDQIKGLDIHEDLNKFANIATIPDYVNLKETALKLSIKYPILSMHGGTNYLGSKGQVLAKTDSTPPNEISDGDVYQGASFEHNLAVISQIKPALVALSEEHIFPLSLLVSLAKKKSFVVQGQEQLWAQGLYAGFKQSYEVALPILVPVLENSLRHVLMRRGVITSPLNRHDVQEEITLGMILGHEIASEVFGYDCIMDLKGLLIEPRYANIRNKTSHGLMSTDQFYSESAIYLWWLCFRLFMTHNTHSNQ